MNAPNPFGPRPGIASARSIRRAEGERLEILLVDPLPSSNNILPSKVHGNSLNLCPKLAWETYLKAGSIRRAGQDLGVSHSTVHEAIIKGGYKIPRGNWSAGEIQKLTDYYADTAARDFSLDAIAIQIGRPYAGVALKASRLGLADGLRPMSDHHRNMVKLGAVGKWKDKPHPKGFQGHKHSVDAVAAIAQKSRQSWATQKTFEIGNYSPERRQELSDRFSALAATRAPQTMYSRAKQGKREDLGDYYFRSSWEANYARYLNFLKERGIVISWEYEPRTFWFLGIKRGVRSYKPDFYVIEQNGYDYWVEVKGYMDAKSKTKIARIKKYYPEVILRVVGAKEYKRLKLQLGGLIPCWE